MFELTLSQSYLFGENAAQFSAATAIHTVLIFGPPGTHYCWVDRGGVDSRHAQSFDTLPALWVSNPRPIDLNHSPMHSTDATPCNNFISVE